MARRAQDKAWVEFIAWCRARRLTPLPAHPWTVAAYARWCEGRHRYPAIITRIRAISRAHLLRCCPPPDHHPTVARTLRLIEARERTRSQRASLFSEDDYKPAPLPAADFKRSGTEPARRARTCARAMAGQPRLVSRRPRTPS